MRSAKELLMSQKLSLSILDQYLLENTLIYDQYGKEQTIKELTAGRSLIISFVLGSWGPECLDDIERLREKNNLPNAQVAFISIEGHKALEKKFRFNIQSDEELRALLFGCDKHKSLINMFNIEIPSLGLSHPATFIIKKGCQSIIQLTKGIPNDEENQCDGEFLLARAMVS
jgi:hypothetical protein